MMNILIEKKVDAALLPIFQCIGFWNEEGLAVYQQNKERKLGTPSSQEEAQSMGFLPWRLKMLYYDCESLLKDKPFVFGLAGSHLFVSHAETNERIIMVY